MKIKIQLTEEQQTWLLRFLNHEWYEELNYQEINGDTDTTYLEDMLEVYCAILGKPKDVFSAISNKFDIEDKLKEIKELKERY